MTINIVAIGGEQTNLLASTNIHEPNTFAHRVVNLPRVAFETFWRNNSVTEQISLTIFDEAVRKRIESWQTLKMPKIDVVLGSAMIRLTLSYEKCVG